ncbi:E3 ubiquitin-protein ligase, partial [Durusdinium trenchii]
HTAAGVLGMRAGKTEVEQLKSWATPWLDLDHRRKKISVPGAYRIPVTSLAKSVEDADVVLGKLATKVVGPAAGGCIPIARNLAEAKDLYEFLKSLLDEDLLQLQDSMESHSDELLRMDTIFALDDVRRLFK